MAQTKTVKLYNGRTFPTRWQPSGKWWVSDINKKASDVVVLTFTNGATTFKRMYAKWFVEFSEA